jgi:hypothetical protein
MAKLTTEEVRRELERYVENADLKLLNLQHSTANTRIIETQQSSNWSYGHTCTYRGSFHSNTGGYIA